MKAEDIRIETSELSNTIYAGKVSKEGTQWLDKHDVTEQVLSAVARYMDGTYSEITFPAGTLMWKSKSSNSNLQEEELDKKQNIINSFIYRDKLSAYGDIMTLAEFIDCVESTCFIDYDGSGRLIYLDKEIDNSDTYCDRFEFKIGDDYYDMSDIAKLFEDEIKVVWFNK